MHTFMIEVKGTHISRNEPLVRLIKDIFSRNACVLATTEGIKRAEKVYFRNRYHLPNKKDAHVKAHFCGDEIAGHCFYSFSKLGVGDKM